MSPMNVKGANGKVADVPLPPPPPKKSGGINSPIFLGSFIFLLIVGIIAIYATLSQKGPDIAGALPKKKAKVKKGFVKVIFVDSNFAIYNEKVDAWADRKKGDVPFGVRILTGPDSNRNIFSVNKAHTIRAAPNTKFVIDSAKATKGFKQKVLMMVEEGKVWIETAGDIFDVHTPKGIVVAKGGDFEVDVGDDNSVKIYAWNGNVEFKPTGKDEDKPIEVKEKHLLFIDSVGNVIPAPIDESSLTLWQKWNLLTKAEDALTLNIKAFPEEKAKKIATEEEGKTEEVSLDKEPAEEETPTVKETKIPPPPPKKEEEEKKLRVPAFGEKKVEAKKTPSYPKYPKYEKQAPPPSQAKPPQPPPFNAGSNNVPTAANKTPMPPFEPNNRPPQPPNPPPMTPTNMVPVTANPSDHSDTESEDSIFKPNPLENRPTMDRVPGMGIDDKPVGPPGGTEMR